MLLRISALDSAVRCMGIKELKPKIIEAVTTFVLGKDTFVSLPTGYAESIIFLLFDFLTRASLSVSLILTTFIGGKGSIV